MKERKKDKRKKEGLKRKKGKEKIKKARKELRKKDINNIKRRHYVDIFIPSQNKCIEVKSDWTIKTYKNKLAF